MRIMHKIILTVLTFIIVDNSLLAYDDGKVDVIDIDRKYNSSISLNEVKCILDNTFKNREKFYSNLEYVTSKKIQNRGEFLFYKFSSMRRKYLIIPKSNTKKHTKGFILTSNYLQFVKLKKSENYYIGAIYIAGFQGNLTIYDMKKSKLSAIFETKESIFKGDSSGCEVYINNGNIGLLKIENIDINNDGFLDLKFTGTENHYCNKAKGEADFGMAERKVPLKSFKVKFIYLYDPEKNTWVKQSKKKG